MSDSVEKGLLPSILLKRDNYEEWNQSIMRKMNEVPMMVGWIPGNQDAETDFTVIPFQTRFTGRQVPITHHGIAPILGRVNVAPAAKDNLINLISLVNNGYSFYGDKDELIIKDSRGRVSIRGKHLREQNLKN